MWEGDTATQWALEALRNAGAAMGGGLVRPVEPPDPAVVQAAAERDAAAASDEAAVDSAARRD
eukprot:11505462-Alexandrium_andersonii.AAC.1